MTRQVEKINKHPPSSSRKDHSKAIFVPLNLNTEQVAEALKVPAYQLQDLMEGKNKKLQKELAILEEASVRDMAKKLVRTDE